MFALRQLSPVFVTSKRAVPIVLARFSPPSTVRGAPQNRRFAALTLNHSGTMSCDEALVRPSASWFQSLLTMPSSVLPELFENGLYWISTLKRRRKMMNKHKLRKRRKKNRMKNKK